MLDSKLTRRRFVCEGVTSAAALAAGLKATETIASGNPSEADTSGIVSYNSDMEYRRCGKTDWMVSVVCLGGHWKRLNAVVPNLFQGQSWLSAPIDNSDFEKNRYDVVTRCLERGINYVDACTAQEVMMYAKALKGRRDKMYFGYSWYQKEMRFEPWRPTEKLKESFTNGLKEAGLDYVDLWRITLHEGSGRHSEAEIEGAVEALRWAKKEGLARAIGFSSHDRPHIKWMIEQYTDTIDVIVTPYTARTKVLTDETGLWAAMQKLDVGWFGIKPFASASVFKGDSSLGNPHWEEDNRIARLALRYILCNPAITAPIPGLIDVQQVDNAALAVMERRELDREETADLNRAMDDAWANLPYHYQWLKDWEYV